MIKHERHRLSFHNKDGSLTYPGEWVLTWVLSGSVWHLIAMVPISEYLPAHAERER
jgi:hypothetical protein